ncbi:MAG TPA: bifunctional diaminohydroxyphosphoribosylaminopyrimidine deaminase/5-amino-6-(5-phosphoribosylamino)uracil reductase RibD [Woeseiaceae bacterium]|nr:bifunctional diaminohydroxyphosphoribosylaminopyrimidine deaminase/5-amino-6-(5-phosphoribosylamino)uracil reductase RibD [Woeseiaceae bacterium]
MNGFSAADHRHMARALRLAARGLYTARPNPMVGCVIVRGGTVIGEGWHRRAGEGHAEAEALRAAGDARGATVYVTLEPCAHHGRTPPCADALVAAGVAEVVYAMQDPNELVDGRGHARLREAGVRVRSGLMADAAAELNRGFVARLRRGRPFATLKVAASLDGATAMLGGESQWITGPAARADVQRLRARAGAVLTGIGTVLADDPSLTVRDPGLPPDVGQPLRAIVDSGLRMPLSAGMLCLPGRTVVYCTDDAEREPLVAAGAEVVAVPPVPGRADGRVDLAAVLADLAGRGINEVLVEGGPTLAGALLEACLVDELVLYQAPHVMGSETLRMVTTPGMTELARRRSVTVTDRRQVGADTRITARFAD